MSTRGAPGPMPAVILAAQPLGESDLLIVLLTPELGKVRAAARHARKSKKRFTGGLPTGALGTVTLVRRREGALWRMEAFSAIAEVSGIGRDLERFAYVAYLCELTDVLVVEPEPDPRRFAALAEAIGETLRASARAAVLRRYEIRLLDTLGLLPVLEACCVCGNTQLGSDAVAFDGSRGGALCELHARDAAPIPAQTLELATLLLHCEDPQAAWAQAQEAPWEVRRALRDLTVRVIRPHLRRPLRSLEFLAQVATAGPR